MNFKTDERGFVFIECVIALPLLLLLLYALVTLTLTTAKIAREQVKDYVLETEAQYVIDRITADARTAYSVEIKSTENLETVIFKCHSISSKFEGYDFKIDENGKIFQYRNVDSKAGIESQYIKYYKNILDPRIYAVYSASTSENHFAHIYFKRQDDDYFGSPITGENSYGNTFVTQMKFSKELLSKKILHITFEMKSSKRNQKVKFTTAVYMPGCEKIIYHGEKIL